MKTGIKKEPWYGYYKDVEGKPSKNYKTVVRIFKEHHVQTVLDFGCGNGRHTIPLCNDGFSVYGFDKSKFAVAATRRKLREENLDAKIIEWDMLKPLPYKDCMFDAVLASRVMYHARMKDIRKVVNEVVRVLKEGGYLYFEGPTYRKVTISDLSLSHSINGRIFRTRLKEIEPGTYLTTFPGEGVQVPYHIFRSKGEVIQLFNRFKVLRLDFRGRTLRMLARKIK